jgi:hypothetical protein
MKKIRGKKSRATVTLSCMQLSTLMGVVCRMVVRATREIAEGEDITHTYVDPLEPLLVRNNKSFKYFYLFCITSNHQLYPSDEGFTSHFLDICRA